MKAGRILVLGALALLAAAPEALAQQPEGEVGLRLGLNFPSVTGDVGSELDGDAGIMIGFYAAGQFGNSPFGLQGEWVYTQKAGRVYTFQGQPVRLGLEYIEMPVMLRFAPLPGRRHYVTAGGALAMELNTDEIKDAFDYGAVFGAGTTLDWGFGSMPFYNDLRNVGLNIDVRYTAGLRKLGNVYWGGLEGGANRVLTLSIGLAFDLGMEQD